MKKRFLVPAIGIPTLGAVAAITAGSLLSAPGLTALGEDVGLKTSTQIEDVLDAELSEVKLTFVSGDDSVSVSGSDVGLRATSDSDGTSLRGDYPLWEVPKWNESAQVDLQFDEELMTSVVRDHFSDLAVEPESAQVTYADGAYSVTPEKSGRSIDFTALAVEVGSALSASQGSVEVDIPTVEVPAKVAAADLESDVDELNDLVESTSFTLDDEPVLTPSVDEVAEWLDVTVSESGLSVTADAEAIQKAADPLPEQLNREVVNGEVVVDEDGEVLKTNVEGRDGYSIESVDGVGEELAGQLESLEGSNVALSGEVIPQEATTLFRRAEVDKAAGETRFYENEKLVKTVPVAIGAPGTETDSGEFKVYTQLASQNMGSCDASGNLIPGGRFDYCTSDVPWISYYNGDEGFHGTYWHNNFGPGAEMSHGCVNLSVADAEWSYRFLQVGTPVSVS